VLRWRIKGKGSREPSQVAEAIILKRVSNGDPDKEEAVEIVRSGKNFEHISNAELTGIPERLVKNKRERYVKDSEVFFFFFLV
jgi:hypothetical protein